MNTGSVIVVNRVMKVMKHHMLRLVNFKSLKCDHKHNQLLNCQEPRTIMKSAWKEFSCINQMHENCASLCYDRNFASVSYKSVRYLKNIEWNLLIKKVIPLFGG